MNEKTKRLFSGFSIAAPWPESYPKGRIIENDSRHLTLAFLGNVSYSKLKSALEQFPKPSFQIGPVGQTDALRFLPKSKPRVVAHHIHWLVDGASIDNYQRQVLDWLEALGFSVDRRPFMPHVTLARAPFDKKDWEETFQQLPLMITGIHLYESLGNLHYKSLWKIPLHPAFEEFEHTADMAFHIYGKSFRELYIHATLALCFHFPRFLSYINLELPISNFNDLVAALNRLVSGCDQEIGCPIKAVSYHGTIKEEKTLMHWEMIVDV